MKTRTAPAAFLLCSLLALPAQLPENLVIRGIPDIPPGIREEVGRYLEFRTASMGSWHPTKREMLILTRFAETPQIHQVSSPGGARRQLTFFPEPVRGVAFRPKSGRDAVFSQDTGGAEFYQLYRLDMETGEYRIISDGKSRNTGAVWSRDGAWLAYASTRRNGRDNDIYLVQPESPATTRMVAQVSGGGWQPTDWSPDGKRLLLLEYLSINHSRIHQLDVASGRMELLTPEGKGPASHSGAQFSPTGEEIYFTTDRGSEFHQLVRKNLRTGEEKVVTRRIPWDVSDFRLSPDGTKIAFFTNEDGISVLHLLETRRFRAMPVPALPPGIGSGLEWHENSTDLGFTHSSAKAPADVYSFQAGTRKLARWTESETGGLNSRRFSEPRLVQMKSFDGLPFSAFLYEPDASRFPGKRPVVISIHGGPESQSRPGFQARMNFLLEEMGIAILYPNVRGSAGYGKNFLTLDNGMKREDSVRDIGAVLDWIQGQPRLDSGRVAVMGGSYGGYMVLASMIHFADRLRAGVDVVGISNFITFLQNTQDYRRDLRRVEYGDEREPAMKAFLEKISPANQAAKITKPLLIVQGKNDPRVPVTESEQMVAAIEKAGGKVWYLMATDEGHGFAKKRNADFQFLVTVLFLREHLLK